MNVNLHCTFVVIEQRKRKWNLFRKKEFRVYHFSWKNFELSQGYTPVKNKRMHISIFGIRYPFTIQSIENKGSDTEIQLETRTLYHNYGVLIHSITARQFEDMIKEILPCEWEIVQEKSLELKAV